MRREGTDVFERFTDQARKCLVHAEQEAGLLGHTWIGTEHLLLGLAVEGDSHAALALAGHGLDAVTVRASVVERLAELGYATENDEAALARIGIDLDAVRTSVEATFGEGALSAQALGQIPFTVKAKHALELALVAALDLVQDHIAPEHLVLGMVGLGSGVADDVIAAKVEPDALRAELEAGIEARRPPDDRPVVDIAAARPRTLIPGFDRGFEMLRADVADGVPVLLDMRDTDADRTKVVDQATGFAAGVGRELVRLANGVYLLKDPATKLTPETRRALLASLM